MTQDTKTKITKEVRQKIKTFVSNSKAYDGDTCIIARDDAVHAKLCPDKSQRPKSKALCFVGWAADIIQEINLSL